MYKSSEVISGRLSKVMNGIDYDEFFRENYAKMFKECLDIADIEYFVTAVGILGKALENQVKEYFVNKVTIKTMFSINTGDYSIKKIRAEFVKGSHFNRIKLLNGQEVKIDGKSYKLKRSLLKEEDYNELLAISRARNDSFHGCDEERYNEIDAKAQSYIDRGVVILAMLEKHNRQ
jgi:hypothetical protein